MSRVEGVQQRIGVTGPHLDYYGGKVLTSPGFASIFVGSYWNSTDGRGERRYLDSMARAVIPSRHTKIWEEYGGGKGRFLGSTTTVLAAPPRVITDRLVQRIVGDAIKRGAVPPENGQNVYTVFLPPGVELKAPDGTSSRDGMGGYHFSYTDSAGAEVYYAAVVYADGAGENGINFTSEPKRNISITATHEWFEAVTDPDVARGDLGWYDELYGEVGDIPIETERDLEDTFGSIKGYSVQKEWSNRDGRSEVEPLKGRRGRSPELPRHTPSPHLQLAPPEAAR